MEEEKLLLSDYLHLTVEFEQNPTTENEVALTEWLGKLIIRDYMPIKEKAVTMVQVLTSADKEYDAPGAAMYMEINKVVLGLFQYCVNLENDADFIAITMGAYDNFQQYGLIKTIKNVCEEDYGFLCRMIDNAFNIANVKLLADTAALLNETEYGKWIEAMKQLKEGLTPEVLEGLVAVGQMSTPEFAELGHGLAKEMLQNVNNQMAANDLRQEAIQNTGG
ncbi:MAG: hypothetical protein J6S67_07605 [Methanobrevibacter sp.]|nr:hypothetical protein [Methanobrevibacter sp.]